MLNINPLHHKKRTTKLAGYHKDLREAEKLAWLKVEIMKESGPVLLEILAAKLIASPSDREEYSRWSVR